MSMSALLHPLCSVEAQRHRHRAHPVGRRVGRQSDRRIVADARYRQDDGSALSTIADDAADWITAGLSLNDISDLDPVIGSMRRALKPDGTLLLTVPHPCFEAPRSGSVSTGGTPRRTIGDYFAGGFGERLTLAVSAVPETITAPSPPTSLLSETMVSDERHCPTGKNARHNSSSRFGLLNIVRPVNV
jgi:SAM-dependent methyltransferase